MRRSGRRAADPSQQLLGIIEAELGSLLDFLPTPLLVTSETGEILRAHRAAVLFVDFSASVVHKHLADVIRSQAVDVAVSMLRHEQTVVRLCALHARYF